MFDCGEEPNHVGERPRKLQVEGEGVNVNTTARRTRPLPTRGTGYRKLVLKPVGTRELLNLTNKIESVFLVQKRLRKTLAILLELGPDARKRGPGPKFLRNERSFSPEVSEGATFCVDPRKPRPDTNEKYAKPNGKANRERNEETMPVHHGFAIVKANEKSTSAGFTRFVGGASTSV